MHNVIFEFQSRSYITIFMLKLEPVIARTVKINRNNCMK